MTTGRLIVTLDGETLLEQDGIIEISGITSRDGTIGINATYKPQERDTDTPSGYILTDTFRKAIEQNPDLGIYVAPQLDIGFKSDQ